MARFLDSSSGLTKQKTSSGLTLYSGTLYQMPFDCMISGPGVFNTAHALTVYLEQTRPDLILHTGIAGAFSSVGSNCNDIGIGDIAVATQEQYIHTGVGCNTQQRSCLPFDLIEGHPLTRQGIYKADPELLDIYHGMLTGEFALPVVRGNFITVSSITATLDNARKIYKDFFPVMEAMEGAAAFHVAALYDVPIIEIRAASNYAGERDKASWNFPLACERVYLICEIVTKNGFQTNRT